MKEISALNFPKEVLQAERLVLVDFWASWCKPCQALIPTLEGLMEEYPHICFVRVSVEESPELATKYKVMSLPTLLLFNRGKPIKAISGSANKSRIKSMLEEKYE